MKKRRQQFMRWKYCHNTRSRNAKTSIHTSILLINLLYGTRNQYLQRCIAIDWNVYDNSWHKWHRVFDAPSMATCFEFKLIKNQNSRSTFEIVIIYSFICGLYSLFSHCLSIFIFKNISFFKNSNIHTVIRELLKWTHSYK